MPILEFKIEIDAPLQKVWEFHSTLDGLKKVTPAGTKIEILDYNPPLKIGSRFTLVIKRFGIPIKWEVEYVSFDPPNGFIDQQVTGSGPFKSWRHEHRFIAISENKTLLHDYIAYEAPFLFLGKIAEALFLKNDLVKMFAYRHKITKELLEKP